MTIKEAIRLIHPSTTGDAIREIEYFHGFNGKVEAIKAIEEASIIACECMKKVLEEEENDSEKIHGY